MEIQTIQSAVAGIHRINEFLALEELPDKDIEWDEKCGSVKMEKTAENQTQYGEDQGKAGVPFVEFRDVTFGYDSHIVLDHVSFKVMDGEQVTLSGRTGAEKVQF